MILWAIIFLTAKDFIKMSWLKKSTWNVVVPKSLEKEIGEIASFVAKYYLESNNSPEADKMDVFNPYLNSSEEISVVILPFSKTSPNKIAEYDHKTKQLIIYPHNLKTKEKNVTKLTASFYEIIKHELAHVFDPKFYQGRNALRKLDENTLEYYNSPTEFDAYCLQMSTHIKNNINDKNIYNNVVEWLKSDVTWIPDILEPFMHILRSWMIYDENAKKTKYHQRGYVKTFKLRLYNELFGNR